MKFVQPIRDTALIENIKEDLRLVSERNYILFCMGIYTGLRISDILKIRAGMVRNKTHIKIIDEKTRKKKKRRKERNIFITRNLKADLDNYIRTMGDQEYLFPSRQKKMKNGARRQPIDRMTAYRMLNAVAKRYGLSEIGCHTMRKTWGYHLYRRDPTKLALLMDMFGHSSQWVTLRYLGLTQDAMDEAFDELSDTY
ncbi:tyrosine-type recombinase/integrase [Paenibacillus sp. YYML68]|uniref:tyrosine-type recombinase/integrase n=1 Tax=Paenibacillus sp. YYML68 TaxID=2909250 RepID=UPI002493A3EA|nr:tyrosine-type recombinase/integrase [Paenibacillus sp. YYML68]